MQYIYFRMPIDSAKINDAAIAIQDCYGVNIPGNSGDPFVSADQSVLLFKCPFLDQVQIDGFIAAQSWAKLIAQGGECLSIWYDADEAARQAWMESQNPVHDPDFIMPSDEALIALFNA